jgi:hypothetical protein
MFAVQTCDSASKNPSSRFINPTLRIAFTAEARAFASVAVSINC